MIDDMNDEQMEKQIKNIDPEIALKDLHNLCKQLRLTEKEHQQIRLIMVVLTNVAREWKAHKNPAQ